MFQDKKDKIFYQIIKSGITDKKIIDAFVLIPRENFVLEEYRTIAYNDSALPIGHGQTLSQPFVVALMTHMLDVQKEDKILEIGTGSGYQSAILSVLAKETVSFEILKPVYEFAKENLKKCNIKNVKLQNVDGSDYFDKKYESYFDKIVITAASGKICDNWAKYLKEEGLLVMPEGKLEYQVLKKYKKKNNKLELVEESIPVRFVPLTGKGGQQ